MLIYEGKPYKTFEYVDLISFEYEGIQYKGYVWWVSPSLEDDSCSYKIMDSVQVNNDISDEPTVVIKEPTEVKVLERKNKDDSGKNEVILG